MNVSFIGHQTWLVESAGTNILVDPLLKTTFGASKFSFGAIYPFREVDFLSLPKIDAIVLSHEHPDHFCIDSLSMLDTKITVYVGPLMVESVKFACLKLGFNVKVVYPKTTINIGNIEFTLYPAGKETPFWENRVYQIYFKAKKNTSISFFLAVDAGMSTEFIKLIHEIEAENPKLIALSNNSQITKIGRRAAFENAITPETDNPTKKGFPGLQVYKSLVVNYLIELDRMKDIVICGGGFLKGARDLEEQPYSEQNIIAENVCNSLTYGSLRFLKPGETLKIDSGGKITRGKRLNFIKLRNRAWIEKSLNIKYNSKLNNSLFFQYSDCDNDHNLSTNNFVKINRLMQELLGCLQLSSEGWAIYNNCIERKEEPKVEIGLISSKNKIDIVFELNLNNGSVIATSQFRNKSSYGLKIYTNDLLSVLSGEIEFWDLSGSSLASWYVGAPMESLVPFLYGFFGECVRQDLALKMVELKLRTKIKL
ncbi:MAG: MBL fold metallo-hydrolase [Pseudobdellovibrionaceae bacterium]